MKVWTNGCFDVLHRGHIELFRYARTLGDELIVGIDTDEKVRNDKGKNRPINNLHDRMFMLQSIQYIDKVVPLVAILSKWLKILICLISSPINSLIIFGFSLASNL